MPTELVIRRHNGPETLQLKEQMLHVYGTSHAEPIRREPFLSEEKFWQRLVEMYAPGRDFETVSGWLGDTMVGYAFGSPRDNAAATWERLKQALPDLAVPVSEPIYIFREFAVHPQYQGRGYGRRIHDELLSRRPEPMAHLLVRQENEQARGAYSSWGWQRVDSEQPFPDAPVMDAMVRTLPLA